MGRAWKPGDVALVGGEIAIRVGCRGAKVDRAFVDGLGRHWRNEDDAARPLVVIDPEDPADVERVCAAYRSVDHRVGIAPMQAALRSLVADPKPDEPLGRYAVVLDADGTEWVRDRNGTWYWQQGPAYRMRAWDKIAAVRVLSEGVTP